MKAVISFFLLQAIAIGFIVGVLSLVRKSVDPVQATSPPSWPQPASGKAEDARKAILTYLRSRPWASGDKFEILHTSDVLQDLDRFGPDARRSVSIVKVEYIRRLADPHPESAPPSPEQFVFVLGGFNGFNEASEVAGEMEVIRSLPVDRLHKPYADRF